MGAPEDWWKDAVVYQVYPWSFNDSNGDGVGDIPGVTEKLDYLAELGVDVVWLTPVYESPKVDNGYDISDYRSILPEFGTMADWEELLAGLHDRDMKLIMDIAVNHTSDEHRWFQRARESPDSEYRDYYIWRAGEDGAPPNNWESHFGGSAWAYDERTDEYYLHLYHRRQPDLNWANPDLREEIYDVMRFWLEKGIDGFRLDVVNLLSKPRTFPDGDPAADWVGAEHFVDGPRITEYLAEMHDRVFSNYDCVTVGEMPELTVETATEYVGEDGPLDMAFHFELMQIDFGPGGRWDVGEWTVPELKRIVDRWQTELAAAGGWNTLFLNNHDQPRSVSRFGDDGTYRRESAKALATMLFTLQGTPFVYQGEEIGMTNARFESVEDIHDVDTRQHAELMLEEEGVSYEAVRDLVGYRSRDNARTPMQWSAAEHGGFTDGEPWIEANADYPEVNVATERADPDSVWHHYRRLIELRDAHPVLVYGDFESYLPAHDQLFVYTRSDGDDRALVVLNLTEEPAVVPHLEGLSLDDAELLVANYQVGTEPLEGRQVRPYESRVYLL